MLDTSTKTKNEFRFDNNDTETNTCSHQPMRRLESNTNAEHTPNTHTNHARVLMLQFDSSPRADDDQRFQHYVTPSFQPGATRVWQFGE